MGFFLRVRAAAGRATLANSDTFQFQARFRYRTAGTLNLPCPANAFQTYTFRNDQHVEPFAQTAMRRLSPVHTWYGEQSRRPIESHSKCFHKCYQRFLFQTRREKTKAGRPEQTCQLIFQLLVNQAQNSVRFDKIPLGRSGIMKATSGSFAKYGSLPAGIE